MFVRIIEFFNPLIEVTLTFTRPDFRTEGPYV